MGILRIAATLLSPLPYPFGGAGGGKEGGRIAGEGGVGVHINNGMSDRCC